MQVCEIEALNNYSQYFQPQIPKFRECRYVQIIVLRETKSHAIFTTDGQCLHTERMPAGIENPAFIERVMVKLRGVSGGLDPQANRPRSGDDATEQCNGIEPKERTRDVRRHDATLLRESRPELRCDP